MGTSCLCVFWCVWPGESWWGKTIVLPALVGCRLGPLQDFDETHIGTSAGDRQDLHSFWRGPLRELRHGCDHWRQGWGKTVVFHQSHSKFTYLKFKSYSKGKTTVFHLPHQYISIQGKNHSFYPNDPENSSKKKKFKNLFLNLKGGIFFGEEGSGGKTGRNEILDAKTWWRHLPSPMPRPTVDALLVRVDAWRLFLLGAWGYSSWLLSAKT